MTANETNRNVPAETGTAASDASQSRRRGRTVAPPALVEKPLTKLFYGAPLIGGESISDYNHMTAQVNAAVEPEDVFDRIYVKQVVDANLEIERLRHVYIATITVEYHELAKKQMGIKLGSTKEADQWMQASSAHSEKYLSERLNDAGINTTQLQADALRKKLGLITEISKLLKQQRSGGTAPLPL